MSPDNEEGRPRHRGGPTVEHSITNDEASLPDARQEGDYAATTAALAVHGEGWRTEVVS